MNLMILLLSLAVPAGHDWFYPGRGDQVALLEPDDDGGAGQPRQLKIGGLPVERTGRLLARVDDPAALRRMPEVAAVEALGGDGHVVRLWPRAGVDEIALSRRLHGRPGVSWSHPDFAVTLRPARLPDDRYVRDQWHLANVGQRGFTPGVDIHAELAWTRTIGKGALVAVIDTGVDLRHPDLAVTPGHDYVSGDDDPSPDLKVDGAPHGTAVAGIAAAIGGNGIGVAGVAYGGGIYAIRLIGGKTSLGDFYGAFSEAVDAGAWVLSNSWGYGDKCDEIPNFSVYDDAIAYAETMGRGGLGSAVVFAAGNGNCDISTNHLLEHPEIVVVAASNGDDRREGYSSFGRFVKLSAPSGAILTTDIVGKNGYGSWHGDPDYYGDFNGTSASTPVVSGALMLMFAANPRLTAAQARQVLCDTAAKIDDAGAGYDAQGWSPYYGCGRLDAGAAVAAVANRAPEAPVIVAPRTQAFVERVDLEWRPAVDADGDWLSYTVRWKLAGSPGDATVEKPIPGTHLDLTSRVTAGQSVVFTVQAADLWGPGPESAPTTFAVVHHPVPVAAPPPSGCSCRSGGRAPLPALALLAPLALLWRPRRRMRPRPGGDPRPC